MPQPRQTSFFEGVRHFDDCLSKQFDLCRELEELADSLPSKIDTRAATRLANDLQSTLHRCHQLEETIIFPVLLRTGTDVAVVIERLRQEHLEDEDHANDVCDTIRAFGSAQGREDAEKLGYMLRCLFVSLRRHLAFDCHYVLPLFRRTAGF